MTDLYACISALVNFAELYIPCMAHTVGGNAWAVSHARFYVIAMFEMTVACKCIMLMFMIEGKAYLSVQAKNNKSNSIFLENMQEWLSIRHCCMQLKCSFVPDQAFQCWSTQTCQESKPFSACSSQASPTLELYVIQNDCFFNVYVSWSFYDLQIREVWQFCSTYCKIWRCSVQNGGGRSNCAGPSSSYCAWADTGKNYSFLIYFLKPILCVGYMQITASMPLKLCGIDCHCKLL